ncbi:MAG: hypothetical protein JRE28_08895 [Deltaproteobacteria bacterium]|nr:hypothetical protein [Deltaproteobacteria bacterium]
MEKAIQTVIGYETKIRDIGLISKNSIWKNYKKQMLKNCNPIKASKKLT